MSHLTHPQVNNLLKQQSLQMPGLYHSPLKTGSYESEVMDSYQAHIQQRLWEITSEKFREVAQARS